MTLRLAAVLLTKLAAFTVVVGWIAVVSQGSIRICCAAAAILGLAGCFGIHRFFWRCPHCHHLLGAALGTFCTWCGQRIRR